MDVVPQRQPAIEVNSVSKRFGRTLALDDVSLSVAPGEIFAVLGPNGAGKSTLIDLITTVSKPDAGWVRVNSADVNKHSLEVRLSVGVVFQEPTLDTRLTVVENLEFHGLVYRMRRKDRRARMDHLLELLELSGRKHAVVGTLSAGMRRRLEIARALMHNPAILLLDEPTVGLDAHSRAKLWDYVRAVRHEQLLTTVVTTHYIEEVESCDTVCILDSGRVLVAGSPNSLKETRGQALLRVTPRNLEVASALRNKYPDAVDGAAGDLVIPVISAGGIDDLLRGYGSQLRQISVDQPSLESVFLSLTGRELREQRTFSPISRVRRA